MTPGHSVACLVEGCLAIHVGVEESLKGTTLIVFGEQQMITHVLISSPEDPERAREESEPV